MDTFIMSVTSTRRLAERILFQLSEIFQYCFHRNGKGLKVRLVLVFLSIALLGSAQDVKRIISLTPSITENIYLIGAESKLVGCTSYCNDAVKNGIEQVGSTVEVNVEKVLLLQPDLVLAMELTKTQDIEAIRKLGIQVEIIKTPKNFEEICKQTMRIGKLVGYTSEAEKIVKMAKTEVAKIEQESEKLNVTKIFFQIGANPIFTVLENTFMNDFITLCNGKNIAGGMRKGTITRESVLRSNPDVILIASMGGFGAEEQKIWKEYSGLSAVKNDKVLIVSSETSCSPTPANFVSALQDIYKFVSQ